VYYTDGGRVWQVSDICRCMTKRALRQHDGLHSDPCSNQRWDIFNFAAEHVNSFGAYFSPNTRSTVFHTCVPCKQHRYSVFPQAHVKSVFVFLPCSAHL
jgi:hypothetical protein